MNDGEIRALCHRFFDAIEARDVGAVAALYHDDLQFWFNATDKTSTKAENLEAMAAGAARHRRRTYNDRIVHTFACGFVMQYTLNIVQHDGTQTALFPCVVALCHDGKILRVDEYIDSGKFSRPLAQGRTEAQAQSDRGMTQAEVHALCQRFFDAYETRDVAEVAKLYAPDCVIWNNVFNSEMTGAENVEKLPDGYLRQRRRIYNDRIVNVFEDGWVIQYTLNGVALNGHAGGLWVCIVAHCRDGQITRIDEYLDSGKFAAWRGGPAA